MAPSDDSLGDHTDGSLLRWVRSGDQDAATQLYVRYAQRLRALVREQCSSDLARRLEADDIVQSVFRTFFRAASQGIYNVPAGEDLWKLLLVIALNKIRAQGTYHRAAKRDVRRTASLDAADRPSDPPGRLEEDGETIFLQMAVAEILEHLPEPQRQMVQFRLDGYEVGEIAEKTGRAKRTVERLLQDARKRLSGLIREEE